VSVINKKQIVKFAPKGADSFYDAIKHRVEEYFQRENINTHANRKMRIKTVVMLSLYFVPYLCMATGLLAFSTWLFFGSWALMGLGIVGIGASVMHDSNHGSYSTNKHVNSLLGNVLNILGGYSRNWKIQHNILHHTYTNLDGLDEDIDAGKLLRMCPHKPWYSIHRFQHIYAWFLYTIMNLFWITVKDYRLLFRYEKNGMLRKQKVTLAKALTELSLLKVFYIAYMLVVPILFSGFAAWEVILGFVVMHMIAGLALACIFQPAHVMETSEFPAPTPDHRIENTWAVHQLLNTTNFSPKSVITSWFIGGLNFQIEHHLFPHVCHVHYPALSKIVKKTAAEYNLPYQVQPTFAHALWMHGRMLKELGKKK
jgi:linoleoyl-CoA desaturase